MLPQLAQELTGYNSLPCSITSSNYQEENAINSCNRLPLCCNIQSEAINASYNKAKNYNCVLFYSFGTALETTRGSRVKLQWSNSIAVKQPQADILQRSNTTRGCILLSWLFCLFTHIATGRPRSIVALLVHMPGIMRIFLSITNNNQV